MIFLVISSLAETLRDAVESDTFRPEPSDLFACNVRRAAEPTAIGLGHGSRLVLVPIRPELNLMDRAAALPIALKRWGTGGQADEQRHRDDCPISHRRPPIAAIIITSVRRLQNERPEDRAS